MIDAIRESGDYDGVRAWSRHARPGVELFQRVPWPKLYSRFAMASTQDESYYILDMTDDVRVYLGVRDGAGRDGMFGG